MMSFLFSPLGRVLGALAVAASLMGLSWLHGYQRGAASERQAILTKIERQNNAAGNSADSARGSYDKCIDGGGVWDFGAGKCRWP